MRRFGEYGTKGRRHDHAQRNNHVGRGGGGTYLLRLTGCGGGGNAIVDAPKSEPADSQSTDTGGNAPKASASGTSDVKDSHRPARHRRKHNLHHNLNCRKRRSPPQPARWRQASTAPGKAIWKPQSATIARSSRIQSACPKTTRTPTPPQQPRTSASHPMEA